MKKNYLLGLVFFGICALAVSFFMFPKNATEKSSLIVNFKNASKVSIYDKASTQGDGDPSLVAEVSESGSQTELEGDKTYLLRYDAADGFSDGEVEAQTPPSGVFSVNIDPALSEDKLGVMLDKEIESINQTIKATLPNINLYEIQRGKLFGWGDWYGTTIKYIGNDTFNSDVLRLVMKKDGGAWTIKTNPPDITLSKKLYPDIPEEFLRETNSL